MDWLANSDKARKLFEQPVSKALGAIAGIFSPGERLSDDEMRVLALLKAILTTDSAGQERALNRLRSKLEAQRTDSRKIGEIMHFLVSAAPGTPESALPVLKRYDRHHQSEVLANLLLLAIEHGDYREDALATIRQVALELDFTQPEFDEMAQNVRNTLGQRTKLLKSGTGIILALIVIALFILTATYLSSLLFGLALAYIFLPLEQYFERRFFPATANKRKNSHKERYELAADEQARRELQSRTNKATYLTVGCVGVGGVILLVLLGVLATNYIRTLNNDISVWMHKQQIAATARQAAVYESNSQVVVIVPEASAETTAAADAKPMSPPEGMRRVNASLASYFIELQDRFQQLPFVQGVLTEISTYFANGEAQRNLWSLVLKKSGGFFAFLAQFLAGFASLLLNILLTFFFFSLLLNQLAMFVNKTGNTGKRSTSYLMQSIFNGKWLPAMSEENLAAGDRIIGESINKLQVWLRGYLTMVLIDMCVYTVIFWWLDVPYFGILGLVAGCGILLPYIGPVGSAILTVLVTLIAGGGDGVLTQIIGIVLTYALYNGIFEQFFSYPHFIGDKLGLTTLETIIVVLLGGIVAGIPGMIFALPAAAVLKYIIPQIYRCWK